MAVTPESERVPGRGLVFAISSNLLWGLLPLVFFVLRASGPFEIVAWRITLSLVFCAILLTVTRGWSRFAALVRDRSAVLTLMLASVLILVNWLVYVYAAVSGSVIEASLGYFTNPIVTVLLGVFILRERLRPLQWTAVGISAIAVLVLAIMHGTFPWIAVTLAFSFGLYGFVKKRIGHRVDALSGLAIETAVLAPVAIAALVVIAATSGLTMGRTGTLETVLMLSLGAITAVPLLLFAAAARRLPLTYIGLAQYISPIIQLVVGVWLLHEDMPAARWVGFGIVWLALGILTVDLFTFRKVAAGRARQRDSRLDEGDLAVLSQDHER